MLRLSTPANHLRALMPPLLLVGGLVLMAVALGLALLSSQPPAPKPVTAPADEFSAARALALAARLLGDGAPHPVGTAAQAQVRDRIIQELSILGYRVETQTTFACRTEWATCGDVTNILSRLPGRTNGPAVLLTAHYDSVPAGPGAADDMAGVAVILEIARILRIEAPLPNPIIFLFSDGEEPALLGAEAFVAEHPWAAAVGVVVNLEARGNRGPSILFETTENSAWLIAAFAAQAPTPIASSVYDVLYEFLSANTDLDVYEEAGLAGINFAFTEEVTHYHTPLDNLANLDPRSVQHQGDNALAAVRVFGEQDLVNPPPGKSVYLDLWPGFVLQWPEPWTTGLAMSGLLVWLGVAIHLLWRRTLSWRSLLWGCLVLPVGLLAAGLLGLALSLGISYWRGAPAPWYAYPLPMRVALWTSALLCLVWVANTLSQRAGYWGVSLGVWLWWALFALLVAWGEPGLSALFLPPTLLAILTLAVVGLTPLRRVPQARLGATLIALFGGSWLWLPFALAAESGAGGELGLLVGVMVGLAAGALVPLVALSGEGGRLPHRWLVRAALVVLVAAATALPWSNRQYAVAPAKATGAPTPIIRQLADERTAGARVIQLQMFTPRDANQLSLYLPAMAGLQRIDVVGTPYTSAPVRSWDGYQAFHCFGPTCDGITLALHLAGDAAFTLFLVDKTFGLPADGAELRQARPPTAVPSGDGDVTLIADQITFAAARQ